MSIDTYKTKRALAILERIGWPEWGDGLASRRLFYDVQWTMPWRQKPPYSTDYGIHPHLALCLLRNHLREWLRSHERYALGVDDDYDDELLTLAEKVLAA